MIRSRFTVDRPFSDFGLIVIVFLACGIIIAATGLVFAQVQLNPGRVLGNVTFSNTSVAVRAHISNHPVSNPASAIPEEWPVRLYKQGEVLPAATTLYQPTNLLPDVQTYVAASFDASPDVENTGSDFVLEIDAIRFDDEAKYRFGSLQSNSSAYTQCQNVLPRTVNSAGTRCDISECAGLVNLSLRFVVSPDHLNDLSDEPVICSAKVFIEEDSGSGIYAWQAESGSKTFDLSSMLNQTASISVLARETPDPLKVAVSCTAKIKPGVSGYVILPQSERSPFSVEVNVGRLDCGAEAYRNVSITIEPNAGPLQGLFDVSGHQEIDARVWELPYYWQFWLKPDLVAPNDVPTNPWRFEGIRAGQHEIGAGAVVDNGEKLLKFPTTKWPNTPVDIFVNQTTDMGSTFVARPIKATGQVLLADPGGCTDLKDFKNDPFTDVMNTYGRSYIEARGTDTMVFDGSPACLGRSSGTGGDSFGVLMGSYDTTQHQANMTYEVLLAGLSPVGGAVNGSDACPSIWDVKEMYLSMDNETGDVQKGYSYSNIKFSEDIHITAQLENGEVPDPIQLPHQKICFGKIRLNYNVNPTIGSIYYPAFSIHQSAIDLSSTAFGSWYSYLYGQAFGVPTSSVNAGAEATVAVTLPEGIQYQITPRTYFIPAGGNSESSTYLQMSALNIPQEGVLGCGDCLDLCIQFEDEEGNYSLLSISFPDNSDYCITEDYLDINVMINSSGVDVAQVGYVLDPINIDNVDLSDANAVILCPSNCGADPNYTISLTNLTPGAHALKVIAVADNGCVSRRIYNFNFDQQPPTIHCPQDVEVELNYGETSISDTDPRIASQLQATYSGGCGLPSEVNSFPHEFGIGQTPVTFWIEGLPDENCEITVTAREPREHYIAFIDNTVDGLFLKVYGIEDGSLEWFRATTYPYWSEYAPTSNVIGVAQRTGGAEGRVDIFLADSGTTEIQVNIPFIPLNIAFNPQNSSLFAVVATKNFDNYEIRMYDNVNLLNRQILPIYPQMSIPEIAWSPDGQKLTALSTQPMFDQDDRYIFEYKVMVFEWKFVPPRLIGERPIEKIIESQVREEEHEVLYVDNSNRLFTSNKGISKIGGPQLIQRVKSILNEDMDISDDGTIAVFVQNGRVGLCMNAMDTGSPDIKWGPTIGDKKLQVAISSDKKYVAVAKSDSVLVYSVEDFSLIQTIPAINHRFMVFRPPTP